MSDSDSAQFVVRLVNQVTAPARAVQKSMADVGKAFADTKRTVEAPAAKRGAVSDWDKMLNKAKMSQRADFAKATPKASAQDKPGGFLEMAAGVFTGEAIFSAATGAVEALGGALLAVGETVVGLGVKFIETATEAAMFAERSTLAIGFLTDNVQQAGNTFDMVRHEAQGLGLDVNDTVGGFQKLLAAQFDVGQSNALIKMGADMQAIGASAEEVQRIIYAMTEIKSIGTLQKRQERMLQMAGISGQLIDKALMARTGIKDKASLDKARKGNKIGADDAIEAIKSAVMMKTHEKALGDVGGSFADTTLAGMKQKLSGGVENFFTDVGQKLLPGLTTIAGLAGGTLGKLMDDPKLAQLGKFLLNRFEIFTLWLQANWPQIEGMIITGFHMVGDAIRWVVDTLDRSNDQWKVFGEVLAGVAIWAAVNVAAFLLLVAVFAALVLVVPILIGVGIFIVSWLAQKVKEFSAAGKDMVLGLVEGLLSMIPIVGPALALLLGALVPMVPGGKPAPGADPSAIQGANIAGSIGGSLQGVGDGKTEGGITTTGHTISIAQLSLNLQNADGDDAEKARKLGAAVRAELEKQLHQVA